MVDFFSLGKTAGQPSEIDPRKLFNQLIKPEGVNDLYASQSDVLDKWFQNRSQKDHILKLPTGGGKSIVGLLIAQSSTNETGGPSVYAVPTRQLVKQVCDEASRFGISAMPYVSAKEGIPNEFLDGRAICVATYDAIFNGKSKFGTTTKSSEVPRLGAMILDDAHAAFESVWDSFTFSVRAEEKSDLYGDIVSRFRASFEEVGRSISFDEVISGKDFNTIEVPYWAWIERCGEIGQLISANDPESVNGFSWQHVKDDLANCHALIDRSGFTIVPILPDVGRCTSFANADRRVFMSATISDDGEVVRTFGVSSKSVGSPIVAASLAGVGERMILAPSMMELPATVKQRNLVESLVQDVSAKGKNCLILTPSFHAAKDWSNVSQVSTNGAESEALIEALHARRGLAVTVPRRFDGVDLPGEDCRLLVLDGLPYGSSTYDLWRMSVLSQGAVNSILAQRVEQAIGRASRGTADYCVVVLTGGDLIGWLGRRTNQALLSSGTKKQLDIGMTVSRAVLAAADFVSTAWQCLNRDAGWRSYHANEMASAATPDAPDLRALEMWEAEREGVNALRIRQNTAALAAFDVAIDKADDAALKGWFHQLKARVAYASKDHPKSEVSQAKAYSLNSRLTPPKGEVPVALMEVKLQQGLMVSNKLAEYMHPGVAYSVFESDVVEFLTSYSSSGQFEMALMKLFEWLGFSSSRPDELYKAGPDVLSMADTGPALIVEAKSRKKNKNKLTKTLHNQVLSHENWFNANYQANINRQRIIVYPTNNCEQNAGTEGTLALTFDILTGIISDARVLLKDVGSQPPEHRPAVANQRLSELGLTAQGIVDRLKPFSATDD